MSRKATKATTPGGGVPPRMGSRITDQAAAPDDRAVRQWIGPEAFVHWNALRNWIDESYPGIFEPDWLYGGKSRGWSLRYRKTKALCTLVPEYGRLSALVVLGRAEREKFEQRRYAWRPPLVQLYDEAKTYIDGQWLTVAIASTDDLHEVMELLAMKRPPLSPANRHPERSGRPAGEPSREKSKRLHSHTHIEEYLP